MKIKNLFAVAVLALFSTGCGSSVFYQVYNVKPVNVDTTNSNSLKFEDENCVVNYNLWGEYGNMNFRFYNKTDKNIYLDMSESFFIINNEAHDYFQNRVYSESSSQGVAAKKTLAVSETSSVLSQISQQTLVASGTAAISKGYSVSTSEQRIVCIPAKTSKLFSEFKINSTILRDCDLLRFPKRKEITPKAYDISDSPLVFSNRFLYTIGNSTEAVSLENKFYVSEIANYPQEEMFDMDYEEFCGEKSFAKRSYNKYVSSKSFYIQYSKGIETWKH
ncbi:hypothetical protein BZG02_07080 [Labilibaculum filiforme]|uniref:Uncharacterized protein n=1 Tax=Labilibaculum filiforme TaxID=1940526 RepID=A0A2N3I0F5_9BACT|nr:hypothetical protein [Labilibaculum filiforme]PKQ63784.1 hypothetical protein BZG02_07080 [Labilibaculum filiforme]